MKETLGIFIGINIAVWFVIFIQTMNGSW